MTRLRQLAAAAAVVAAVLLLPAADAGFLTGVGAERTAHLEDTSNGLNVTVHLPETFDGQVANTFEFVLSGSAGTTASSYLVRLTVSPGDIDLEKSWNASASGPAGAAASQADLTVPADDLPYRVANVPFRVSLLDGSGRPIDTADFSMDLLYHPPPADGGLFQLAGGTIAAWGLVLLYAVYLHRAHQRLRARTDSLERALGHSGKEGEK